MPFPSSRRTAARRAAKPEPGHRRGPDRLRLVPDARRSEPPPGAGGAEHGPTSRGKVARGEGRRARIGEARETRLVLAVVGSRRFRDDPLLTRPPRREKAGCHRLGSPIPRSCAASSRDGAGRDTSGDRPRPSGAERPATSPHPRRFAPTLAAATPDDAPRRSIPSSDQQLDPYFRFPPPIAKALWTAPISAIINRPPSGNGPRPLLPPGRLGSSVGRAAD